MDNNRSWNNKQDVEEILDIINYSLYSSKDVNRNFFLWYMIKKGKLNPKNDPKSTSNQKLDFVVDSEIKVALDKMDTLVETIKAFNNLDMNSDNKKKDHIISIVSIARDDMKNLSYRFEGYIRVFIGFMYGYYLKANIITAMDIINLEEDNPTIKGIPSYAITIAAVLKTIDNGGYLDRKKYPKQETNFTPVVGSDPTSVVTTTSTSNSDKPVIIDVLDAARGQENKEAKVYVNQFVTIKGGTSAKSIRAGKPDVTLDMLELYSSYMNSEFNYKELAEIYEVSDYTIIMKMRKFCEENNLPLKSNNTTKSTKKEVEKQQKEQEDALFMKAQQSQEQTLKKMKSKQTSFLSDPVVVVSDRKFQNKPITYGLDTTGGSRTKLVVSDRNKAKIEKEGGCFCKLNDGKYYYVTSGDFLIFRNEPTPETLEKYRSIKAFG